MNVLSRSVCHALFFVAGVELINLFVYDLHGCMANGWFSDYIFLEVMNALSLFVVLYFL